jgi:hypothetical protein
VEGKVTVSRNSYSGGEWLELREAIKVMNQALREQKSQLE